MQKTLKTTLTDLERRISSFIPDSTYEHDYFALIAVEEALIAAKEGNVGVGAVIVDANGDLVQRGHNRMFHPHFRGDLHAEMDAMMKFEEAFKEITTMQSYTLFSSLECCPMCLTRLITSGLGQMFHVASDLENGMVHRIQDLGDIWNKLAEKQVFAQARCSPEISEFAFQVFLATADDYLTKLVARR